jgi:DNA-binding NarL/FixJ family response regulator
MPTFTAAIFAPRPQSRVSLRLAVHRAAGAVAFEADTRLDQLLRLTAQPADVVIVEVGAIRPSLAAMLCASLAQLPDTPAVLAVDCVGSRSTALLDLDAWGVTAYVAAHDNLERLTALLRVFALRRPPRPSMEPPPAATAIIPTDRELMAETPIRVLLADDHAITRGPLRQRLDQEPDLEVVAEASDGQEALYLAQTLKPDVVLLDLSMPRLSVAQDCQAIVRTVPTTRVIILTGYADQLDTRALASLGAVGFVSKTDSAEHLADTVRAVHRGESRLAPSTADPAEPAAEPPTARELEVLQLVAEGLHNREIAEQLSVGSKTVEFHVANLRGKTGAHSRVEVVRIARRRGWVV